MKPEELPERVQMLVSLLQSYPGFSGQKLIPAVIPKITEIHQTYPDLAICVDGGITIENISLLSQAGATQFVAGSTIFAHKTYADVITSLRQKASDAHA